MSFFLALDHGLPFAASAARGSIAAVAAECAFALAFAWVGGGWQRALVLASAAYFATALAMQPVALDPPLLAALMVATLLIVARLLPRRAALPSVAVGRPPAWDLPARVVVATGLVLAITFVAPALGPYGSAVAASFPLFASILAVFAERNIGHAAAAGVMRGLVAGLFGFMAFFVVIATALVPLGLAAYALAVPVTLAIQAVSFAALRRSGE